MKKSFKKHYEDGKKYIEEPIVKGIEDIAIFETEDWDIDLEEDLKKTKKEILTILKEQKISLSKARALFNDILNDIEDNNPVTNVD